MSLNRRLGKHIFHGMKCYKAKNGNINIAVSKSCPTQLMQDVAVNNDLGAV